MDMLYKILLPVLSLLILLFFAAFFASTETAFTSITRIQIKQLLRNKNPKAKKISFLKYNLERLISTVLTGTNFVNTLSSSIATALAVNLFGQKYASVAMLCETVLIIIFAEIIPKTIAAVKPVETTLLFCDAIFVIQKIFYPVVWLFNQLTKFIKFIERKICTNEAPLVTEEELKELIQVGENEGTLEENEKEMLYRIFEFSDLHVYDILKHRSLVVPVNINSTYEEVIQVFANSGYSQLPVYEDSFETIVGVLHYKAVLFASSPILKSKDFVKICMRPVLFVPETLTALELLQKFKKQHVSFAITVDEYGSSSGLVTMNDLLQAVFGHITDEYNSEIIAPEKRIKIVNAKEFIVPGDMKIDDFNEVLKLNLDSENYDTLGGWLLERFGELPSTGALYKNGGIIYVIEDQSARRIQTVRVILN